MRKGRPALARGVIYGFARGIAYRSSRGTIHGITHGITLSQALAPCTWRSLCMLCMLLIALALAGTASAESLRYCDPPAVHQAARQDALLRLAAQVRQVLEGSAHSVAVVSRSGLDLRRFGQRYSHAGLGLRQHPRSSWAVRQLYYACDEGQARLYDEGLAGFVMGLHDAQAVFVSVLLLPEPLALPVEAWALNAQWALQALSPAYSANAHAFSTRYQNCNQWLIELLALGLQIDLSLVNQAREAFTPEALGGAAAQSPANTTRLRAHQWLREQGYKPAEFDVAWPPLLWAASLSPWLHLDDHPPEDLAQGRFRVSMPSSIEAFLRERMPGLQRLEFCLRHHRVVLRRGWEPLDEDCSIGPDDEVQVLD